MQKLGKKRTVKLVTVEAYATCYPSTKCDSDFLCKCNCSHGGDSASMAPPQSTNCKAENARYWASYGGYNKQISPYSSTC